MKRNEVIERFCILSTKVMEEKFKCSIPADCFCNNYKYRGFQFAHEIMEFIEHAVIEKIKKEKKS